VSRGAFYYLCFRKKIHAMIRLLICFLLIIGLSACSNTQQSNWEDQVEHVGSLRAIMHQNDVTPKTFLDQLALGDSLYGLGAVAYLKGEILVLGGEAIVATADSNGSVTLSDNPETGACLMVATHVKSWAEIVVPPEITTQAALEDFLVGAADQWGINTEKPFPFRLEGRFASLDWHVVDWESGDTEHSHQKHIESGPHGTLTEAEAIVLGFHSTKHTGVFTHYDSDVHMHMVLKDRSLAGHIDGVIPGALTLYLPAS